MAAAASALRDFADMLREAAEALDELADLKSGKSILLPMSQDYAEKMVIVGQAFINREDSDQ